MFLSGDQVGQPEEEVAEMHLVAPGPCGCSTALCGHSRARGCCCCCTAGLCCSTPEGPGEAQCWELQCVGGQRGNANGIAARRYTAAGAQGERDAAQAGLGGWDVPHCNSMWCRGGSACSGHAAVSWWPCRGHLVAMQRSFSGRAVAAEWLCNNQAVAL